MSKSYNNLLQILKSSLEDDQLSRKERRSFRQALEQSGLGQSDKIKLMSRVRDLALSKAEGSDQEKIVLWMYDAFKTIAGENTESTDQSVYMSPGEECRRAIINGLKSATQRIRICVFTISDNEIAEAILERKKYNVDISVISDNDKAFDKGSDLFRLREEGIEVRFDRGPAHMHHKFALLDDVLLTGSYNWTRSAAERNYENILVTDDKGLYAEFSSEFDRLWDKFK